MNSTILAMLLTMQCAGGVCFSPRVDANYGIDLESWKPVQARITKRPAHIHLLPAPRTFKLYLSETNEPIPYYLEEFDTPPLDPGKTYYYKIRAEWPDGIKYEIRKDFKAGDTVLFQFDYADAYIQTYRTIGEKIRNFDRAMEWVENDLQNRQARATETQVAQTEAQAKPQNAPDTPDIPNFGIDPGYIRERQSAQATQTENESAKLAEVEQKLTDDSKKLRFTVIGPESARTRVLADLKNFPEQLKDFVVKDYDPKDWEVANYGFKTDGNPTIYVQTPDGKVLHRQDDYEGVEDLKVIFTKIRTRDPNYNPAKDPDLRNSPTLPGLDFKELLRQYGKEMTLLGIVFLVLAWVVKSNG